MKNKLCSLLYHLAAERPWTSHFTSLSLSFPTCKMYMTGSPRVIVRIKCNITHENPSVLDIPWIHGKIGKDVEDGISYAQSTAKLTLISFNPLSFLSELKNLFIYTPMI